MKYGYYISISVLLCFSPAYADWPQWLGPDRTGISTETGFLKTWPKDGPAVLWKRNLGKGFSGISVADGRVFTMFAEGDDEFVVCLNEESGDEIWRFRTGGMFEEWQGGDGPRSQPTVDGERVYVLGAEGRLYALKAANGETIWTVDLVDGLGGRFPRFGFSTSPLVEGDFLFLEAATRNGTFLALHTKDGKVAWASQNDVASYSSPVAVDLAGARQVVYFSGDAVVGLSPFERLPALAVSLEDVVRPEYCNADLRTAGPDLHFPRVMITARLCCGSSQTATGSRRPGSGRAGG